MLTERIRAREIIATTEKDARAMMGLLLTASQWFQLTPLPDGEYAIAIKENEPFLPGIEILPVSVDLRDTTEYSTEPVPRPCPVLRIRMNETEVDLVPYSADSPDSVRQVVDHIAKLAGVDGSKPELKHLGDANMDPLCGPGAGKEWVTTDDILSVTCPVCLPLASDRDQEKLAHVRVAAAQRATQEKMRLLKLCLSNDLIGVLIEEHLDLEGFIIRDATPDSMGERRALYTAYVAEDGYSSFIAINDHQKGIECADEKVLADKAPLFTAVAKIKTHHMTHSTGLYPDPKPVNSEPWTPEQEKH